MDSMQCYRPSEEVYYENQQYTTHAQTGACDAAGFQLGHYTGFGQQMGHLGHARRHKMGHGMGMQTPCYQMGHQLGLTRHHKHGYGHELGFGHGGQVLGGQAKHHEFDGMVYYRKSEKKIKEKKKCERKKEKHSHKKKDHGSSSSSSSDSD